MTEDQFAVILEACKPTPTMFLSGGVNMGRSAQENANIAWAKLGEELGFKYKTVQPEGTDARFFTAEPLDS